MVSLCGGASVLGANIAPLPLTAVCLPSPDCEDTLPDIYVQSVPVRDYIYSFLPSMLSP